MTKIHKILYIHQDGQITGSAISLRNLLMALDRDKFSPYVLLGSDGPARNLYESIRVPVHSMFIRKFATFPGPHWYHSDFLRGYLSFFPNRQLDAYLWETQPDLVHINDKALLSAGLAAVRQKLPIVWHLRSTYAVTNSHLNAMISREVIRRCADRMIAISEDETDGFEDLNNLHTIHNSVDFNTVAQATSSRDVIRTEFGIRDGEVVIGMVGHLNKERGAWDFIRVGGLASQRLKFLRFVMIGPVPARPPSKQNLRSRLGFPDPIHLEDYAWSLAVQAGISGRLILTGFRQDALAVIAALDILVVCNHLGVLGRPPFEAMAVGCPVVAYAGNSGKSNVVQDRKTALIVPAGDVQAMASAIVELANSPDLRNEMGKAGMVYARENFDPNRNVSAVQEVYQGLLGQGKRGREIDSGDGLHRG
jgi:glycosyltransferase involved in cell wall biosynthesis